MPKSEARDGLWNWLHHHCGVQTICCSMLLTLVCNLSHKHRSASLQLYTWTMLSGDCLFDCEGAPEVLTALAHCGL